MAVILLSAGGLDRGGPPRLREGSLYMSHSGEIENVFAECGVCRIFLRDENGDPFSFTVTDDTFNLDAELVKGEKIVGFTYASRPEILIYPPQRVADIILKQPEKLLVKADYFDESFISRDGALKLNFDSRTVILNQSGCILPKAPPNSALLVFYGASTRSIPAQTVPDKVIVLRSNQDFM